MRISESHTEQRFGSPSGVRDEMITCRSLWKHNIHDHSVAARNRSLSKRPTRVHRIVIWRSMQNLLRFTKLGG